LINIFSFVRCTFSSYCIQSLYQQAQVEMSNKEMFLVLKIVQYCRESDISDGPCGTKTSLFASSLIHINLETRPVSDTWQCFVVADFKTQAMSNFRRKYRRPVSIKDFTPTDAKFCKRILKFTLKQLQNISV